MGISDIFKPKWKHSDWRIRQTAVKQLTDQKILSEIALTERNNDVRRYAVIMLRDQKVLTEIALFDSDKDIRKQAISNIYDQNYIVKIVKTVNAKSRMEAVEKLEDISFLTEIAKNEKDRDVRWMAVFKLKDQEIMAYIAINDSDYSIRSLAVERLEDQNILSEILSKESNEVVRRSAQSKLHEVKRKSCSHVFGEWYHVPCCVDAPYCNCTEKVEHRVCSLCGETSIRTFEK